MFMKKLLFLLLGMAVAAGASAGVDMKQLPQVQPQQMHKIQPKQIHATQSNVVNRNSLKLQTQKTTQFWNAFAGNQLKAAKKRVVTSAPSFKAPVTTQPEGEVKTYTRSGTALYSEGSSVRAGNQSGTIQIVYAPDGETVYFKNLLYTSGDSYGDHWMSGTIVGNEIHVPLGQSMYYSSYYDADIITVWGTSYVANGSVEFTPITTVTEAVYLIDGNTISLQGTEPGTGDYAAYEGVGLSAYWSDDATWDYVMEWNTVFTLVENTDGPTIITDDDVVALAQAGGYLLDFNRKGEAIVAGESDLYIEEQSGVTYVYITDDFSTVYMRDPVYDLDGMGSWVMGTFDGEKIHIPLGQYIMWDEDNLMGYKTGWGTFVNGTGFTVDATVTEVTYTFDMEALTITLDNSSSVGSVATEDLSEATGLAIINDNDAFAGFLNWSTAYYIVPNDPTNLTVDPGTTTADVAWEDELDSQWNLRYRPYVEMTGENYFWDFEDTQASDNALPGGWTTIDADGDGYQWYHLNTAPQSGGSWNCHSGNGHVTSASWVSSALTPDNWLVSPQVTLNGVLSFWAAGQDVSWAGEVFAVYVSTGDPTDVNSFVKISDDITATATVTEYTFDLSAYTGQTGYVAIRHYNISDMFRLNIDDVFIGDPDAAAAQPEWIYVNGLTATNYTIEGLTPETTYEVQVQSYNEGGASEWTASVQFTTLAEQTVLRGDVNRDGSVSIADVTTLIDHLLSNDFEDSENFSYANSLINDDETVSIADVTALIDLLLAGGN